MLRFIRNIWSRKTENQIRHLAFREMLTMIRERDGLDKEGKPVPGRVSKRIGFSVSRRIVDDLWYQVSPSERKYGRVHRAPIGKLTA